VEFLPGKSACYSQSLMLAFLYQTDLILQAHDQQIG